MSSWDGGESDHVRRKAWRYGDRTVGSCYCQRLLWECLRRMSGHVGSKSF